MYWIVFMGFMGLLDMHAGLEKAGISFTEENNPFSNPKAVIAYNGLHFVLDRSEKAVFAMDSSGSIQSRFGRQGMGPGEFLDPTAMHLYNGQLWIFDGVKGVVSKFKPDGEHLGDLRLTTGYEILFYDEGLIVKKGMSHYQFHHYDLEGELISNFGERGNPQKTSMLAVTDFLSRTAINPEAGLLYSFYLKGDKVEVFDFRKGVLVREEKIDLEGFTDGNQLSKEVKGDHVSFKGDFPVKGATFYNGSILVLVKSSDPEMSSFLVTYDQNLKKTNLLKLDSGFNGMSRFNDILTFTDKNESVLEQYKLN